jgi:hypothetical protein
MKQYKISAESFSQPGAQPDAVMDLADLADLQRLAGIQSIPVGMSKLSETGSNISVTGNEKAQLMKKHSIKPGTPEWFQLWFSRPYLTNEPPVGK